jgi:uncharacterized protein
MVPCGNGSVSSLTFMNEDSADQTGRSGKRPTGAHFGVVLEMGPWEAPAERLTATSVHFLIEPHVRLKGQSGEQATLFLLDPSGNALQFRAFGTDAALFAT